MPDITARAIRCAGSYAVNPDRPVKNVGAICTQYTRLRAQVGNLAATIAKDEYLE